MNRILAIVFLLVPALLLQGQVNDRVERAKNLPGFDNKRLHFGFTVGLNAMDLAIQRNYDTEDEFIYADVSQAGYGFQVSIVSDLRLSDDWNLRFLPGISFSQISISYYDYNNVEEGRLADRPNADNPVSLGPARLDFPLLFKYRAKRDQNYRPYVIGGVNFRYDLAAKREFDSESEEYVKFYPTSLSLEFGFGVDTYLRYFKFAPEIKLAVGLTNILSPDTRDPYPEFATSIDRITPFLVMLNFHFE